MPQPAAASGLGRRFLWFGSLLFALSFAGGAMAVRLLLPPTGPTTAANAVVSRPPALPPAPVAVIAPTVTAPATTEATTPELAEVEVRRGDTLLDILTRAGIAEGQAHQAVGSLREVADLRRLQVGQRLALQLDPIRGDEPLLARLVLPMSVAKEIHLVRAEDGSFAASSIDRELRSELVAVATPIAESFYAAGAAAGLPHAVLAEMIRLLSWDVDFQRDIQPGDRLEAVYRRHMNEDGEVAPESELEFASLAAGARVIDAYRFTTATGAPDYFDRVGRPLRKWLLRTPVDGARLSSRFGPRRHPVLGYTRMHKGIDFAAPAGTPILAAGAGVVDFVGRHRGYGNYVRLVHNREFATAYAHLSRFPHGLARGQRIAQGEVIGYVGATGLATGPHLHYEVLQDGRQVNPLGIKTAAAEPLGGDDLRRFLAQRDRIDRQRRDAGPLLAGEGPQAPSPARRL